MESNLEINWFYLLAAFLIGLVFKYIYFYILHRIYGAKLLDIKKSGDGLSFKTSLGRFRISKKHKKVMYQRNKDRSWKSLPFEDITGIHVATTTDTASILEFFFSDFNLLDFKGKYRDVLHTCEMKFSVYSDHPDITLDVNLLTMKQYEQREFFLGQLFYEFDVWLMTKLGFYTEIDKVRDKTVKELIQLLSSYGLTARYKHGSRSTIHPIN